MAIDIITGPGRGEDPATPAITRCESGSCITYTADKSVIEKIKSLSDEDFEKEISGFDPGMQTFFRMMRNRYL